MTGMRRELMGKGKKVAGPDSFEESLGGIAVPC